MNIRSLDIKANSIDDLIGSLKSGFSADSFDKLKKCLKISDNMLSKIVHIPQRTLTLRRQDGRLRPVKIGVSQQFDFDHRLTKSLYSTR